MSSRLLEWAQGAFVLVAYSAFVVIFVGTWVVGALLVLSMLAGL